VWLQPNAAAAAAAAFSRVDIRITHRRGTIGRPAAAVPATTILRTLIRRLRQLRRRQPRTDGDGDGVGGGGGHVAHRRAGGSAVDDDGGDHVERDGPGTDRQQSDLHGSRHVVRHSNEGLARIIERTNECL